MIKGNKKGITLIEVLVSLAIFTLGLHAAALIFVKIWKANSFILEEGEASMAASKVVNDTVKNLRKIQQADNGEYPIKSGNSFSLVAYSDIDNDDTVERVHYFLEDEKFKLGIAEPSGTPPVYPTNDQQIKTLASYVTNTNSQPVFEYYNELYPGDLSNNPMAVPVSVNNVRLVKVKLVVNIKPISAPDNINIESYAELRNLNDYNL